MTQQKQPLKSLYGRDLRYVFFLHLLTNTVIALSASYNSRMIKQAKPVYVIVLECHRINQKKSETGLVNSEMSPTYRRRIHRRRTELARCSRAMMVTLHMMGSGGDFS